MGAPHMLGWPAPMSRDDDLTFVPAKEFRLWQRIGSEIDGRGFMKLFSVDNSSMVSFEQHGMETLSHMLVDALESRPNDKVISALPAKQLHKATKQTLPLEDFKSVSV